MQAPTTCYCRCICHTPTAQWPAIISDLGRARMPLFGDYKHGAEADALNGECSDCRTSCNHDGDFVAREVETDRDGVLAGERDPLTLELAAENASPDPMRDWSESERAYAFGDR